MQVNTLSNHNTSHMDLPVEKETVELVQAEYIRLVEG